MEIIKQAHDKLFKETFGRVELARDFMQGYLPKEILDVVDLSTLEPKRDTGTGDLSQSFDWFLEREIESKDFVSLSFFVFLLSQNF